MFKRAKTKVKTKVAAIQTKLSTNKRLVRAAQLFLVGESVFGLVATVATVTAWLALAHPLIAAMCAAGYVFGVASKFVCGVAAG